MSDTGRPKETSHEPEVKQTALETTQEKKELPQTLTLTTTFSLDCFRNPLTKEIFLNPVRANCSHIVETIPVKNLDDGSIFSGATCPLCKKEITELNSPGDVFMAVYESALESYPALYKEMYVNVYTFDSRSSPKEIERAIKALKANDNAINIFNRDGIKESVALETLRLGYVDIFVEKCKKVNMEAFNYPSGDASILGLTPACVAAAEYSEAIYINHPFMLSKINETGLNQINTEGSDYKKLCEKDYRDTSTLYWITKNGLLCKLFC